MPDNRSREQRIADARREARRITREAEDRCILVMRSEAYAPTGEGSGSMNWGSSDSDSAVAGTTGSDISLITGNRHYVIRGNHRFDRHGDVTVNHDGNITVTQMGNLDHARTGSETITLIGNRTFNHVGALTLTRTQTETKTVIGATTHTYVGMVTEVHAQNRNLMEPAQRFEMVNGDAKVTFWARGVTVIKTEAAVTATEIKGIGVSIVPLHQLTGGLESRLKALRSKIDAVDPEVAALQPGCKTMLAIAKFAANSVAF